MAKIWLKRATEWHERSLSAREPLTKQAVPPNPSAFCKGLSLPCPALGTFPLCREKALVLPRQAMAFSFGCE